MIFKCVDFDLFCIVGYDKAFKDMKYEL